MPARGRRSLFPYPFRLARRELRGGIRGFRIFLACLVLGVTAIAGIGSLTEAVVAGIRGDARLLLGGDVSARLVYRAANEAEHQFLTDSGTLSEVAKLRAMARSRDGGKRSLIELQAVDGAYPLYGGGALAPALPLATALSGEGGIFCAGAQAAIADRLRLQLRGGVPLRDGGLRIAGLFERPPHAPL